MLPPTFVPGFHDEASVRKMQYRRLGETDMIVSVLGLGGAAYSNLFGDFTEEEAIATIREAIKKGINYVDGGYWYGHGKSEEVMGKALEGIPRKAYYLTSKVARYEFEWAKRFDFSAEATRKSIERSLRTLKVEYLDLIQVHDIDFSPSLDYLLTNTLPVLQEAVDAGKARYLGITGENVALLKQAVEGSPVKINTILSYNRDTLLDDALKQFLPFFQGRGIGVVHGSATVMGILTNVGPPAWHPAPDSTKAICAQASKYCKEQGVELGKLAVHYCLSQSGPALNLVSMPNRELLNANLKLVHEGLSQKETEVLKEVRERYLSKITENYWEGAELRQYRDALAKVKST